MTAGCVTARYWESAGQDDGDRKHQKEWIASAYSGVLPDDGTVVREADGYKKRGKGSRSV